MNTVQLIRKKREKQKLKKSELQYLIEGYTKGEIPDYQFSAFLMAAFLNGLDDNETAWLTETMLYSGTVVDLSSVEGAKIDKHSTGGVGDKVSLIIAPVAAAAGIKVPMISGRGLGHTGGTLDKLESINGFRTDLNLEQYKSVLSESGAVLIGQTEDIAPADKLIYSLRDVTATVESIPLITGSIMSKKLAEGIDGLVLDVKTGSGAFMKEFDNAKKLADNLINTAKAFDKQVTAFITDMNQPLGNYIGNWLEVLESVKVLSGESVPDLYEISVNIAGAMIYLGGKAESLNEGKNISEVLLQNGTAFEKFLQIVELQSGDTSLLRNPEKYPTSNIIEKIYAPESGYLSSVDNYEVGMSALELGAGRKTKEDKIDPKAGIIFNPKIGGFVEANSLIAELHTDREDMVESSKKQLLSALKFSSKEPVKPELIKEIID